MAFGLSEAIGEQKSIDPFEKRKRIQLFRGFTSKDNPSPAARGSEERSHAQRETNIVLSQRRAGHSIGKHSSDSYPTQNIALRKTGFRKTT